MDAFSLIGNIQSIFAFFDGPLRWLSLHAFSKHYLLLAAIIYWSGYHKIALRLICAVLLSTLLFIFIKPFINAPRPYWLDAGLFQGIKESGYGMPSGHSQNAVVFWGLMAWSLRKTLVTVIALSVIAIIALSRVYLGVHFPSQVLVGLGAGLLIMMLWVLFEQKVLNVLATLPRPRQLMLLLAAAFTPLIITLIVSLLLQPEHNGEAQYKHLVLLTGLAAGLSISQVFSTQKQRPKPGFLLFFTQALPGAVLTLMLWQMTTDIPALIKSQTLIYSYCLIRGLLIACWAMIAWPWLHGQLQSLRKQ